MRLAAFNPVRAFLPEAYWQRACRYFAFGVDFNMLAASAPNQGETFTVDNGYDFLCLSVSEVITTDAAAGTEQTFPEMLVQISTSGSGLAWTDGFQHAGNLFGRMVVNGMGPFDLPYPQLVRGGASVLVSINNLEATERRVWMSFHGVLIDRSTVQK